MASPRPRAVVKLIAYTDTGTNCVRSRRMASVPTIANPPMASGRSAATTLPKTITRATIVRGTATASARAKSWEIWVLIW